MYNNAYVFVNYKRAYAVTITTTNIQNSAFRHQNDKLQPSYQKTE